MKNYCFTLDDNIRFLEELSVSGGSLADSPYISVFKNLNEKYGAKFQLNMYYSYTEGSFSLSDVSEKYKADFERFSSWLRLSFHSLHNTPTFPYENASAKKLIADFELVQGELERICGKASLTNTTTLHYVCAKKDALSALSQKGVKALVGMFYDLPDKRALRYCLSEQQAAEMRKADSMFFEEIGLTLVRNHAVLDKFSTKELSELLPELCKKSFVQIMTHEQYFYPDYVIYHEDYAQRLELCVRYLSENGFKSVFLEEVI